MSEYDALNAFSRRRQEIDMRHVLETGKATALDDPRDTAARIERLARGARLGGTPFSFESIGALAVSGWLAACRAEELDITAGDDEAA